MSNPISPKGFEQYGGNAKSNTYHPAVNEMFHNMGQEILWRVEQAFKDGFIAAHRNPDCPITQYDEKKLEAALKQRAILMGNYLDQFVESISYE